MHLGLVMECDYREGATQEEAFDEAFRMVETAETLGLDGVWLAERHFAARRGPLDALGAGIPSIVSAPLTIASAIAARTQRCAWASPSMCCRCATLCASPKKPRRSIRSARGAWISALDAAASPEPTRVWHSLWRESGTLPRIAGDHPQGLDGGAIFLYWEVLHLQ